MPEPILITEKIFSGYYGGDIVKEVELTVCSNEIVTVIGPNGAGKSTLIKTIAGLVPTREGNIFFADQRIDQLNASEIARLGIAYVPQEANVFRTLTVSENLEMGAWTLPEKKEQHAKQVYQLFPALKERKNDRVGNLSGGQRQMVALGMALMVDPKILLLDEPSAGLSPKLVSEMFDIIKSVNQNGVSVLMVEQNAIQALKMSDRAYVLASGKIKLAGPASELLQNVEVRELYLGVSN